MRTFHSEPLLIPPNAPEAAVSALHVATLVSVLAAASPALAAQWETYRNDDLGFSVAVPKHRFATASETMGRVQLRGIDSPAQLDLYGVENPDGLTLDGLQQMIEAADPNRRITYRAGGRSWFVLSGYLDDGREPEIFYAKFMLNARGTALSAFEISYPQAQRDMFDPLVERIEDSLTAPL